MARPRRRIWAFALSAAVALTFVSSLALADGHDSDDDTIPDVIEAATQRNVVAVAVEDELSITSRLENPPFVDEFGLTFDGGTFTLSYERGDVNLQYELELRDLVVFADGNGNGRVDEEEILSTIALGSAAFENVWFNRTIVQTADGGRVANFTIQSSNGVIALDLTVAQRFLRLTPDRILTPMEVKLDIQINSPSIQAGQDLALGMRMETEGDVEYADRSWDELNHFAVDDGGVNVTGGSGEFPVTLFFSWAKTASADGRNVPVTLTEVSGGSGSYEMYLIYSLGGLPVSRLVHDPTFGVRSEAFEGIVSRPPPLQADYLLYGGTLVAMAALVGGTIFLANRRRKKREE